MSELEVLLEELVGPEDMSEKEQQMESEEKNTREDQDRAIDMKKKAMEKLSEAENRKSQEQDEVPGKSPGDLPVRDEYRKERNEVKLDMRKKEQKDKTKGKLKQQNQTMMSLISKLLDK